MHPMNRFLPLVLVCAVACDEGDRPLGPIRDDIERRIEESGGEVGLYFLNLGTSDSLLIDADVRMHAASTMKVPVMIQLFRDADEELIDIHERPTIRNEFASIVDGSPYQLSPESDSDTVIYSMIGDSLRIRDLIQRMITRSSNLATNMLIELAGAARVTETMRSFGAESIEVLRGVEDGKAYEAGLSNTTTARDLGVIFAYLAEGRTASPPASREMLSILEQQEFRHKIPAGLPEGTRVANKTGLITGISHDAAIVYPDTSSPYVLVILVRGLSEAESTALIVDLSRMIYEQVAG